MHTHTVQITLSKTYQRKPQDKALRNGLQGVLEMFNTRQQKVAGWELIPAETIWTHKDLANGDMEWQEHLLLTYSHAAHEHRQQDVTRLLAKLASNCENPKCGRWTLTHVDGGVYAPPADADMSDVYDAVGYANCVIPDDWEEHFTHLYGLDDHIERVRLALEAGMKSGWQHRFNAVLHGAPACGKSDVALSIAEALGPDAVVKYDATATTGAGAISDIVNRDVLPRVIIIEEIEKADPKGLSFLLAILDLRGEIRKVTARENIERDCKMFAICTVNDMELFESLAAGALASRFTTEVAFERPTREVLVKILVRELDKVGGDHKWIDPCLDFCESQDITDPRQIIAHCVSGADKWMDGSYQKMVAATSRKRETVLAKLAESK